MRSGNGVGHRQLQAPLLTAALSKQSHVKDLVIRPQRRDYKAVKIGTLYRR
jgi:hypothetical protein